MLAPSTRATSIAILISNDSTFLPRYSGVRPTIRPAMNTARIAPITSIPYMPAPMPPGVTSPSSMLNSGTSPAIGWKLSCQALIAPVLVPVVTAAEQPAERRRRSGSPCPPCCRGAWSTAGREQRVADRPRTCIATTAPTSEDARHRGEDRPALALVAGVPPERVGQGEREHQDREHLEPVRERGRVLERVGGVRVEEAAAVVAQLLDPLLGGDRAHGDASGCAPWRVVAAGDGFQVWGTPCQTRTIAPTIEIGSSRYSDAAGQVDPVVAERLRAAPGEARGTGRSPRRGRSRPR